ncbi:acetoacetyl-CoA reductase [Marmoricola endophyticus]|uniref:Acetoacetyl-CoA reductase n=1 Tax=Marmoricola endophyticus TaxID=2040280 RepID=A0A917F656_9ACTN|nr:SDR family oxidoreductase [Marmoricola endophyticus]GGF50387.1 acetoacetyl-CoA reductase [Marmoricola endophyticus]
MPTTHESSPATHADPTGAVARSQCLAARTALVTGSSRGIGLEIARLMARAGAEVVLHGRDAERLDAAARMLRAEHHRVHQVRGALDDAEDAERIHDEVTAQVGVPDVVVANAGGSAVRPGPVEEMTSEEWAREVGANLTSTFHTVQAFIPAMKSRGSGVVLTVSSTATRIASPQSPPAYTAAKAGVEMLTRTLAAQTGPYGVRANCLAAATVLTERNAAQIPHETQEQIAAAHPLRRLGTVEDVAALAVFLASDAASWITGEVIDVAGGSSIT